MIKFNLDKLDPHSSFLHFKSIHFTKPQQKMVLQIFLYIFLFLHIHHLQQTKSQPYDYPSANLSTTWINNPSIAPHSVNFTDSSSVTAILLKGTFGPKYACGFFCNGNTCLNNYLFAIFIVQTNSASYITSPAIGFPQVVWSANRNSPVSVNSSLNFTSDGDLQLKDVDGRLVWSTNTSRRSVVGMTLTELGNLILYDSNNSTVWQSFDHPTDSLVPGQKLVSGNRLTASVSNTNWTDADSHYLTVTNEGLYAFVKSNPFQAYYANSFSGTRVSNESSYIKFLNGSLALYILNAEPNNPDEAIPIQSATSAQYMKLGSDGHLRVYEWLSGWKEVNDLLTGYLGLCQYPMVCGKYGICSDGQCSCPVSLNGSNYFRQINDRQPDLGCSVINPITCESSALHSLLELSDTNYFNLNSDWESADVNTCKQACLTNCSCKAAIFQYGWNFSDGRCYLPSEVFSLMNNDQEKTHLNSSVFLKVQNTNNSDDSVAVTSKKSISRAFMTIIGTSLASFFGTSIVIAVVSFYVRRNKKSNEDDEEEYFSQVPGMPERFSYEDLKTATENFSVKLGEGGFGAVYEGTLATKAMKIAVKRLDGLGHIKQSFLAEVETIGSIHHVNLVRLVGFCADKSHRLLVYEYMPNGSLEKWIFNKNPDRNLTWQQRKKIILDIAKGLTYLHEDCRQKIIHLDIKPQNILLDDNFNAKVSDFGLSKLIDRDQSQVMTTMRGTPGYLAPEWLNSVITEKVDVYSYGVVLLEILCGRKNLDRSQILEEDMHLLSVFKRKAEAENMLDMVDKYNEDMQLHGGEIVEMMKVAAWCLQSDFAKRPSMSVVVKVLEGVMDVENDLDYSFSHAPLPKFKSEPGRAEFHSGAATPLLPSILSGPSLNVYVCLLCGKYIMVENANVNFGANARNKDNGNNHEE